MGSKSDDSAKIIRRQENQRQAMVNRGMEQINSIYGGGKYGSASTDKYVPGSPGWNMKPAVYYDAAGNPLDHTFDLTNPDFNKWYTDNQQKGKFSGSLEDLKTSEAQRGTSSAGRLLDSLAGPSNNAVGATFGNPISLSHTFLAGPDRPAITREAVMANYAKYLAKTGGLYTQQQKTTGFDDNFFNKRAADYRDFAMPQFNRQLQEQSKDLVYSMANRGLTSSSASADLGTKLGTEADTQRRGIVDQGQSLANALRQQVEGSRTQLVSQLNASGDPATTTGEALRTAAGFQAPSTFQPIGNLFNTFANTYLANQANQAYTPMQQGYGQRTGANLGYMPPAAIYN